jgi:MazG family protein
VENFELTPDPILLKTLCDLIETLRGPSGCPWDRKQTPLSIVHYLTEEVYELADAVAGGDSDAVSEELGDVLFLVLFLVQLYREENRFGLDRVLSGVQTKMVRRHPHVFDDLTVENSAEVSRNWVRIKQAEKPPAENDSVLDGIPHATPGLSRAYRISEAVAKAGFDPRSSVDIWRHFDIVMRRIRKTFQNTAAAHTRDAALGDLIWVLIILGRSMGLEPDAALSETLDRFEGKFRKLEAEVGAGDAGGISSAAQERIARLFE